MIATTLHQHLCAGGRTYTFDLIALQATPFVALALPLVGAGKEVRTPVFSLATRYSTTILFLLDGAGTFTPLVISHMVSPCMRIERFERPNTAWKAGVLPTILNPQYEAEKQIRTVGLRVTSSSH